MQKSFISCSSESEWRFTMHATQKHKSKVATCISVDDDDDDDDDCPYASRISRIDWLAFSFIYVERWTTTTIIIISIEIQNKLRERFISNGLPENF